MKTFDLMNFLFLGENLHLLFHPNKASAKGYQEAMQQMPKLLDEYGLSSTKTTSIPFFNYSFTGDQFGNINALNQEHLRSMMMPIRNALFDEVGKIKVAVLTQGKVSEWLRKISSEKSLTDAQRHLLDETIRSVEVEAYRATIVMGWAFAYEYLRQWVWDNAKRRTDLNAELMTWDRKGVLRYPSGIVNYSDFWTINPPLGEWEFLEALVSARILRQKVVDDLIYYLRQRNSYAHANDSEPTMSEANTYLEKVIKLVSDLPV